MKKKKFNEIPTVVELEQELQREKYKKRYQSVLKSTTYSLITVAAVAVLVATLWMPVLQIYGSSMTPTLENGNIVVSIKTNKFETGEVVAFYYNNKILVKRVIAGPGDWVNLDEQGNVYVNGDLIEEPYLEEKAKGACNIELPYQVPESQYFVMGDHRSVSVDSRNSSIGCVANEQIVGKIVFNLWPITDIGMID